ncbi:MAG: DUF2256 domain-containing protein [Betaproteobacteria bacterium]|nr:DUF2256 domain-containing protein [Betaproteobacteria bacterium]
MPDHGKSVGGFRNPHNLPVKVCVQCARPFTWRKKWASSWSEIKYCSDACRKLGARAAKPGT